MASTPLFRYGVTVAAVAVAMLARWLTDPFLGDHLPFATFFVAVVVAAWAGGLRTGLLATAAGFVLSLYFFVPPRYSFVGTSGPHFVGLVMYFVVSLAIAGFGEAVRVARRRDADQKERLRTTLASIGDAVITTDTAGRVTNLNAVAETLTGWANADAVGQPLDAVFNIVNETTRKPVENPAFRALKEGVIVGLANHTVLIARDGSERPIDDSAAPIRCKDGEVVGCVLVFRDITERHKAERALRDGEARKAAILATALDCIITIDHDGRVLDFNPAAERTFGYRKSDVAGRDLGELIVPPAMRDMHRRGMAHYLATGEGPVLDRRLELTALRSDGSEFPVELAVTRIPGDPPVFTAYLRDITDRKRLEREAGDRLQAARFLAAIIESSEDAIVGKSLDGTVQSWNAAAERLFGHTAAEAVGRHISLVIPPDRAGEEKGIIARVKAGQRVEHFDTVRVRKDGTTVDVALTVSPVKDEAGRVVGASKIVRDITDRIAAERSLRESEDRAVFVRRAAGVGFWYCDLPFDVLQWDELVKAHFWLPPDAPVTIDTFYARIHPDDREPTRRAIDRSISDRTPYDTTYRTVAPDTGAVKWVRAIGRTFYTEDGTPTRFDGVTLDVTEQKRAEERLREGEERYRTLVEQVQEHAIFGTDDQGRATTWNEGVRRVLGFEEAEFVGQDIVPAIFTPEDVASGVAQGELDEAAATGSASNDRWMVRKDGTRFWAAGITTARRDENNKLIGFTKVMRDMTAQKAMEDELRQLAADLSEAARRKDEFLATLAHELRNPLAPIRNGLQVMKLADRREVREQARDMMERQVAQMAHLIDDLMDLSRISRGKIVLQKTRLRVADVVRDAVDTARPLVEERGHALAVDVPPEPLYVDADRTRLAQVFGNLLNNAAKYTDKGGRIRVAVGREGGDVVVAVEDNGVGIPADMLPKVFDIFTQVDRSLEKSQGGLGIGLSIVKRLVEMHGGSIVAESGGHGAGSRFVVRLPVVLSVTADGPGDRNGVPTAKPAPRRILVVDDNVDGADSLATMLEIMGNETRTAHDGLEAVAVAEAFGPDVILMDIGMPKLNGFEACRRIRERPWGRNVVIVAQTGWGQEDDRRKSQEAGFNFHMVKPVDPAALEKMLAGLLVTTG